MPTIYDRFTKARKSPIYRVLQIAPTPARPWLLALESFHFAREKAMTRGYERRERSLRRELQSTRGKRKGGIGLGRILLAAGFAFAAAQLNKQKGQKLSVSGFMKSPSRETADKT